MIKIQSRRLKPITIVIVITLITGVLAAANIIASNTVATTGRRLQNIEAQTRELEAQNQLLEKLIAEKKSLSQIKTQAESLSLFPVTQVVSLTSPQPLAQLPGQ